MVLYYMTTFTKHLGVCRNGKRNCTLCLEKLMIIKGRSNNILNICVYIIIPA